MEDVVSGEGWQEAVMLEIWLALAEGRTTLSLGLG